MGVVQGAAWRGEAEDQWARPPPPERRTRGLATHWQIRFIPGPGRVPEGCREQVCAGLRKPQAGWSRAEASGSYLGGREARWGRAAPRLWKALWLGPGLHRGVSDPGAPDVSPQLGRSKGSASRLWVGLGYGVSHSLCSSMPTLWLQESSRPPSSRLTEACQIPPASSDRRGGFRLQLVSRSGAHCDLAWGQGMTEPQAWGSRRGGAAL